MAQAGSLSEVSDLILRRRTARVFRPRELSWGEVRTLLTAACYAPASGNNPSWEVVVVRDAKVKGELAKVSLNQEFIASSSAVFVFFGGSLANVAAAIENLLLAAHAMGLAGCWIGSFDRARVAEILKIPSDKPIHAIVAVGEPGERLSDPGKRLPEEVVHIEEYGRRVASLETLRSVVRAAAEKVEEFRVLREEVGREHGEESYAMYRLEEKYSAFVFRPILRRAIKLMAELGVDDDLRAKLERAVREYEAERGRLLRETRDVNSRPVTSLERRYACAVFPELIEGLRRRYLPQ
mgnify:CR=1 FL=1